MSPAIGELLLAARLVLVPPLVAHLLRALPPLVAPLQHPGPFMLQGQAMAAVGRAFPVVEPLPEVQ